MSENCDNWKRLVTAVVRREQDRRIALSHSRDASSISSRSSSFRLSFSSISQLDQDQSLVDFSDLTLDHMEWKTLLPHDKQGVVWRSASLGFFLDQRIGKNCFLLGTKKLMMSGYKYYWKSEFHPRSRFSEVAELQDSRLLYIKGNIKKKMLSPETSYAAYLVFRFAAKYVNLHSAVSTITNFHDESGYDFFNEQAKQRIVHFQIGNGRADGWMEVQLGDFYVGLEDNGGVEVHLLDTAGQRMSGLIVEGIEFRPFNGKKLEAK